MSHKAPGSTRASTKPLVRGTALSRTSLECAERRLRCAAHSQSQREPLARCLVHFEVSPGYFPASAKHGLNMSQVFKDIYKPGMELVDKYLDVKVRKACTVHCVCGEK